MNAAVRNLYFTNFGILNDCNIRRTFKSYVLLKIIKLFLLAGGMVLPADLTEGTHWYVSQYHAGGGS